MPKAIRILTSGLLLGILLMPSHRVLHHLGKRHLARRAHAVSATSKTARPVDGTQAPNLDESDLQPTRAAADPQDDDFSLKKKRCKKEKSNRFWALKEPPAIEPAGDFLANLRARVEPREQRVCAEVLPVPRFGSGPCHNIPRPREGTIVLPPSAEFVAA